MATLTLKRVSYGKKNTPIEDQEFSEHFGGPVGTIKECLDYAKKNGISKIKFIQSDGTSFIKEIK